jgi:Lrp/AsnC family transcriptional regulator, leucine-responsive regulatory protein
MWNWPNASGYRRPRSASGLVKARVADMTAYRKFLGERLLTLPGVRETRTYAVMEEVKRDAPLPVG